MVLVLFIYPYVRHGFIEEELVFVIAVINL